MKKNLKSPRDTNLTTECKKILLVRTISTSQSKEKES